MLKCRQKEWLVETILKKTNLHASEWAFHYCHSNVCWLSHFPNWNHPSEYCQFWNACLYYVGKTVWIYILCVCCHSLLQRYCCRHTEMSSSLFFRSDEIFVRCIALVFDINCTQIFHPVLTSMGICFSVLVADIVESIESLDLEITLIFDLHAAPEVGGFMYLF